MRNYRVLCFVFGLVFCLSVSSYAEVRSTGRMDRGQKDYYIGVAGSWGYDAFRTEYDFDRPIGFNLKLAMYIDIYYSEALELEMNHLGHFRNESIGTTEIGITSYVLAMRHDLNQSKKVKLYFTWGLGVLVADVSTSNPVPGIDGSDSDLCLKLSIGTDFFLTESVALGFEAGTYPGLGDVKEFGYYNLALGVKYFF